MKIENKVKGLVNFIATLWEVTDSGLKNNLKMAYIAQMHTDF